MKFSFKENNDCFILYLYSGVSEKKQIGRLKRILNYVSKNKRVALNLGHVETFPVEFLDFLKDTAFKNGISLINVKSDLLALLNLTEYNEFVTLYVNDVDFFEMKRQMINRRFSIVREAV